MTDAEWLESVVKTVTDRPCLAEFEPERQPSIMSMTFGGSSQLALWRITIKGIENVAYIQRARVVLRDEENVLGRVLACLPEPERPKVADPKAQEPS